ncbi:MAG: L-ribulose-5-phosphate 4-epimerase [Defluviitaleaceae bacterium]|nr:L-ribulose-5-phosphate 4-epimerase [Defluviitaleaceae bacterium]
MDELKNQVYEANMLLPAHGLVTFTWGNASGIDREKNLVVIKPGGVEYKNLSPSDMVVVDLNTGEAVEGKLKPSSDTATHLELYRNFPNIGGVVHTHSRFATIFSQAKRKIPALGTTHADYFRGAIPVTRLMTPDEISGECSQTRSDCEHVDASRGSRYELETGKVIVETCTNPDEIPAVLVASHGPFTWGADAISAAHNSVVLEELAFMAWHTLMLQPNIAPMQNELSDKHYLRKHGSNAYYGQL